MKYLIKLSSVLLFSTAVASGGPVVQFGGDVAHTADVDWIAQIGADQIVSWTGSSSAGSNGGGTVGGSTGQSAGAILSSLTHGLTLTSLSVAGGTGTYSSGTPNVLGVGPTIANAKFDAGAIDEAWTFEFNTNIVFKQLIISAFAGSETVSFTAAGLTSFGFTQADCAAVTFEPVANRYVYTFAGGGLEVAAGTDITIASSSGQWGLHGLVVEVESPPSTNFIARTVQFGGAAVDSFANGNWQSQIGADQIVQWNGESSWGGGAGAQGTLVNQGAGASMVSRDSHLTLTSRIISSTDATGTNTFATGNPNVLGITGGDNAKFNHQTDEEWTFDFNQDVVLDQLILSALDFAGETVDVTVDGIYTNTFVRADCAAVTWEPVANRYVYTFAGGIQIPAGTDIKIGATSAGVWGLQGVVVTFDEPAPEPQSIPDPLPPPAILPPLAAAFDPLPNFVLFVADDMGIGDSSAYQDLTGNPDAKQIYTPNMERLAERGIRFTDVHSPGSTCTPSRIGLLSGSYPFRSPLKIKAANQDHTDGLMFPGRRHTMAHMLKEAGYRTYGYGKWHLGHQSDKEGSGLMIEGPLESGFDTYTGTDGNFGYPGAMIKDRQFVQFDADDNLVPYGDPTALPWIEGGGVWTGFKDPNLLKVQPAVFAALESDLDTHIDAHANKPLFIYYASHGNHDPYVATSELAGQMISSNVTVSGTILQVPLDPGGDLDGDGIPDPDYADPDYVWSPGVVDKWWDPHFETNELGEVIYNGPTARARMVVENDIIVGELLDFLSETDDPRNPGHKMIDNTLFVFTSDNGADMKARYAVGKLAQEDGAGLVQLNGFKGTAPEGGTRVPFIAAMPAVLASNTTSSAIFGLNDLYATIAEMIGHRLDADEAVDSESLLAVWTNGQEGHVRSEDLLYQHWQIILSRRGEFKLHAKDGDYTGNSNDRFADSNNLDFDDMVVNNFYNLSNDLNEASNLGSTALAVDMLAKANQLGGQGYSRAGAEEPVNGANFTGGDFFNSANWAGYGNIRDNVVPVSPMPGFICTNATVTEDLVGMRLMHRSDTFDFMPAGTGTLFNTVFELRGGTLYATNGPVALIDSQLQIADGLADFGSGVLGMNNSTGTVISLGGTFTAGAISIGDEPGATAGAKTIRFELGAGSIVLSDTDPIRFGDDGDPSDDFINFTAGTRGRLVSVKGAAFYEDLWTNGLLRINGETGTVSFAESGFLLLNQGDGTEALILDVGQHIDSDDDGINDIWEQKQAGSIDVLDETGDYDLDEQSDLAEFILDTDPLVSNGQFAVSGQYDVGSLEYAVAFDSSSSRTYVAEYKQDLLSASGWEVLDILNGTGSNLELSYPVSSSNGFYRVRVYAP